MPNLNDQSTNDTVIQYAVQYQFKNKSPAVAAKLTAQKLSGFQNMFLGGGVVFIDPKKLEEALWGNMMKQVIRNLSNLNPGMESIAVSSAVNHFSLKSSDEKELLKRTIKYLGRPLDDSRNPYQKHAQRRVAALQYLKTCGDHGLRYSLTDPRFNLREVAKQMTLLEDHLCHPYKNCPDCIRKHLLTIEAFAEEAVCLDKVGVYSDTGEKIAEMARVWLEYFHDRKPLPEIAQEVRGWRKKLVRMVADPREAVERVASRHLAFSAPCIHQNATP